jgi:hypothetical protein
VGVWGGILKKAMETRQKPGVREGYDCLIRVKMTRSAGDPAGSGLITVQIFVFRGNPLKYTDPDGKASILFRVINKGASWTYDRAHDLGKLGVKPAMHSLVDKGDLNSIDEVVQYSGSISGFTTDDKNAQDKHYIIEYSGMDDKITDVAINEVLKQDRFGSGDKKKAAEKYHWFSNNCQAFTSAVFKEYEKLWKEDYRSQNENANGREVNSAWRDHKREITKDRGTAVDFSSN